MNKHNNLVDALVKSHLVRDFQRAFTDTTGLPVTLAPVESWQLPFQGKKHENAFCSLMAAQSHSCAHCLQVRQKLADGATQAPCTTQCGAGISESAVPV